MNQHSEQFYYITDFFKDFSSAQLDTFHQLYDVFLYWNNRINLISRKDISNFYVHHVLHALSVLKFFSFPKHSVFVDVGTGGGFPGLPLAIALPACHFILVDSIEKKIHAVRQIVQTLHIENVTCMVGRAEQIKLSAHYALGRAVTSLPQFYKITKHLIQPNTKHSSGIIYLKGGDFDRELSELNVPVTIYNIFEQINLPYFETKKIVFINCQVSSDATKNK